MPIPHSDVYGDLSSAASFCEPRAWYSHPPSRVPGHYVGARYKMEPCLSNQSAKSINVRPSQTVLPEAQPHVRLSVVTKQGLCQIRPGCITLELDYSPRQEKDGESGWSACQLGNPSSFIAWLQHILVQDQNQRGVGQPGFVLGRSISMMSCFRNEEAPS